MEESGPLLGDSSDKPFTNRDEALRCARELIRKCDPAAALRLLEAVNQHVEAQPSPLASEIDSNSSDTATWWYQLGVCYGLCGRHEEALAVAEKVVSLHPDRPEGYYLRGMGLAALKNVAGAFQAFQEGCAADSKLRGIEKSKATLARVTETIKAVQHEKYRRAVAKHCERVNAVHPVRCPLCHSEFPFATPLWLCPRCFRESTPSRSVLLWQPDDAALCHKCQATVAVGSRHHCRSCGRLVCSACSSQSMLVSILGFETPVKVCDSCWTTATEQATKRSASPTVDRRDSLYSASEHINSGNAS